MTRRTLAELAAAFAPKANTGGDSNWKLYFSFWKANPDTTQQVRFIADADEENPLAFLLEKHTHEFKLGDKRVTVLCTKQHGDGHCPFCDEAQAHYQKAEALEKDAQPEEAAKEKSIGSFFYRKKSYLGQVVVIDATVEHDANQLIKLIDFGPQLFKQVMAGLQSGDLEETPYSVKGGYNFRIRKTKNGDQNSYSTSSFAPKQTDLDDALIAQLKPYVLKDMLQSLPTAEEQASILADAKKAKGL